MGGEREAGRVRGANRGWQVGRVKEVGRVGSS